MKACCIEGLSKKKEERYPTCTALVEALEAAFAATPNWKSLGRGASLNLPTMVEQPQEPPVSVAAPALTPPPSEKPPISLPPPSRSLPAPHAPAREEQESPSRVIPILITLVIGGGLAVGAYYGRQWIYGESTPVAAPAPELAKPALKQDNPPPKAVPAPAPSARKEAEPADQATPESNPNPEINHEAQAESPTPPRPIPIQRAPREPMRPRVVTSVELPVRSQPPGATAMLDGLPGTACVTPCVLKAATGEHTISLTLPGYKTFSRSVAVHDTTVDLPALNLVPAQGVLMVQSRPDGATIMVDDKKWPVSTPAQVTLPPGRYRITVEKGNLRGVQTIEIRDGDLRHLIMPLNAP